jgi:hypothetical protein
LAPLGVLERYEDWARFWGSHLGLERYSVSEQEAQEALRFALAYRAKHAGDAEPGPESFADLMRFLVNFGPLVFVVGHVSSPFSSVGQVVSRAVEEVDLVTMDSDMQVLGLAEALAQRSRSEHSRSDLNALLAEARDAWRDCLVEATQRDDQIRLTARPTSLRSILWMKLVKSARATRRSCALCGNPFPPVPGRHRPFEYCELHRDSKFRKQAAKLRESSEQEALEVR